MKQDVSLKLPSKPDFTLIFLDFLHIMMANFWGPCVKWITLKIVCAIIFDICSKCNRCENGPADPLRKPINRAQTNIRSWQPHHKLPFFAANLTTGDYPIIQQTRFGIEWTEDKQKLDFRLQWSHLLSNHISNKCKQCDCADFPVDHSRKHMIIEHRILRVLAPYWCEAGMLLTN